MNDPESIMNDLEGILEDVKLILGTKAPHDMPYVVGLRIRLSDSVETACITREGEIQVGVEYARKTDKTLLASTLHHEIEHWRRGHAARGDLLLDAAKARGVPSVLNVFGESIDLGFLPNLSGDYAINGDMCFEAFLPMSKEWVYPRDMGLESGLAMEDYFWQIIDLHKDEPQQDPENKPDDQQEEGDSGGVFPFGSFGGARRATASDVGKGSCGSGAGGGPAKDELPTESPASDVDRAIMEMGTAQAIERMEGKDPGSFSANTLKWAGKVLGHDKIPWQSKLRHTANQVCSYSEGSYEDTYQRASIYQASVGYGEGSARLAGTWKPNPRIVFVIDTSGSMEEEETAAGIAQAKDVFEALGVSEITFIACDTEVNVCTNVRSAEDIKGLLVGGGGTYLEPALAAADEMRPKPRLVIVVTDGALMGSDMRAIRRRPLFHRTPIVWLVTDSDSRLEREGVPGEIICIKS